MSPSSILPQTEALLSYLGLFSSPTHLTWHRASITIDRTPGPDVRTGVHVGTGTPLMSAVPPTSRSRRLRRPVAARAWPHLRRGHLHPRCAAGGGSSGRHVAPVEMLDAAAPPEAREAGMPLEAHKAITPPADVLGAREPGEDPSKRACTEDVELKMAGFRRFTDGFLDNIRHRAKFSISAGKYHLRQRRDGNNGIEQPDNRSPGNEGVKKEDKITLTMHQFDGF
ncbi:hypothetical protein B0H10DRAFT_2207195 [Mycena sp. CBHHK59/15]|nr:hypothetical protein B0H10DRAFT_2207195 [Mycena sp. CBHHK59/15]